jgi:hypothetical protein
MLPDPPKKKKEKKKEILLIKSLKFTKSGSIKLSTHIMKVAFGIHALNLLLFCSRRGKTWIFKKSKTKITKT